MDSKEFIGKTIQEAVELACKELEIAKEDLKYEIIENASSGIFGFMTKKAKILVKKEKEEDKAKSQIDSFIDEAFKDNPSYQKVMKKEENVKRVNNDEDIENAAAKGKEILEQITNNMVDGIKVELNVLPHKIVYKLLGGEPSILIGRKGYTLEAMQYIVDKLVNKRLNSRMRVFIDVENYLETRKEHLESLAYKLASKAKQTGRSYSINRMSSNERKIIHMCLRGDREIRTQSLGDGYYRKLIIYPNRPRRNGGSYHHNSRRYS